MWITPNEDAFYGFETGVVSVRETQGSESNCYIKHNRKIVITVAFCKNAIFIKEFLYLGGGCGANGDCKRLMDANFLGRFKSVNWS